MATAENKPGKNNAGKLTAKQSAFCSEYLIDLNATQAAIRAGYSEKTAQQVGSENLSKPVIQAEIGRMMDARSKRVEVSAATVLSELLKIGTVDIGEAFNEDGSLKLIHEIPVDVRRAISGIDVFEEFEGKGDDRKQIGFTKKIRFWDKNKALEMMGRHLKMFTDKFEHAGAGGEPLAAPTLSPEGEKALAECLADVRSSLKIPDGLKTLGG